MKKITSLLFLLFLSIGILFAQNDAKYLEGTVPVVDGKVTFTTEISASTISKEQIFETLTEWANKRFQPTEKCNARILYSNPEEGTIAIGGDEFIVFSSSSLALDKSRIYYQLFIHCETGKCLINMNRIRYWYQEERDGGEKHTAEEWITDEVTLNKTKTKLYPINGKFRRKTIDLKDELFKDIQSTLGTKVMVMGNQPTAINPKTQVTENKAITTDVIQPVQVKAAEPKPASQDSENVIKQATRMTITAGNDEQFEINKECWGGFGDLFGKKVAFCLIDTQKTMGNMLMAQSDNYKISFYSANSNEPIMVINCKKLMMQTINSEEAQKMSPNCIVGKSYNMYVGEILK